ncbi:hypothetical protein BD410DRAFT_902931 [Rickenella mellea]|uniref:Uncharacterized protein n=1 Tax=Rickenella mellea TaxID=50990 RepID=A0A4Y7PHW3_9AGAM|nr:hypothetical protein BD410DRAFT_902931 [Rickenella mellea]
MAFVDVLLPPLPSSYSSTRRTRTTRKSPNPKPTKNGLNTLSKITSAQSTRTSPISSRAVSRSSPSKSKSKAKASSSKALDVISGISKARKARRQSSVGSANPIHANPDTISQGIKRYVRTCFAGFEVDEGTRDTRATLPEVYVDERPEDSVTQQVSAVHRDTPLKKVKNGALAIDESLLLRAVHVLAPALGLGSGSPSMYSPSSNSQLLSSSRFSASSRRSKSPTPDPPSKTNASRDDMNSNCFIHQH